MLENLARWCVRRRRTVLLIWLAVVAVAVVLSSVAAGDYATDGRLTGTDSDAAYQLLGREFPNAAGEAASIVFHDTRPGGIAADRDAITTFLARVAAVPRVAEVGSPFDPGGRVSTDGTTAIAALGFTQSGSPSLATTASTLTALEVGPAGNGLQVDFGGPWFEGGGVPSSEGFGLLAAVIVLLVAFGSVVAMGLPIVTAVVGILIGLAGVGLWANVLQTPDFTVQVASMVGIGVGIDYALFIVTRTREALRRRTSASPGTSQDVSDAVAEAIGTAGRAVAFAGCTVVISLLGMFLMGLPFLYGLAVGTATVVLVAVAAALTLLPALLGFAGHRLDRWSIHRSAHRARSAETVWHRWSRAVQRHPRRFALGGLLALLLAGAPMLSMRLARADEGNDPTTSTTRRAFDLVAGAFGPGANGPLLVTLETPDPARVAAAAAVPEAIARIPGVASVGSLVRSASGRAAIIEVVPTTAPQSPATADLVRRLRHDLAPVTGNATQLVTHVGGATASDVDFATKMSDRLPVFIGAVLALSFVLLMAVFRSVLVPLKAVVMNLLSIGAAYGVMVAVFQWGWLASVFGLAGGAPIEPWAPMMLFAIVFGLSMDYEVFLLSAVKEEYTATGDTATAVVEGLASTARVITAAATIMVCVFGSFVVGDLRSIKLIGLGLASAVFIDATIVRMVLVPATMQLLGRHNWWIPAWLDRRLPHVAVDGPTGPAGPAGRVGPVLAATADTDGRRSHDEALVP